MTGSTGDGIVELWLVLILLYSILAASNILSNVPVIMLLEPLIIQLSDPLLGWMIVAWASTIAGNLTLVGSAANLIVAEYVHPFPVPEHKNKQTNKQTKMIIIGAQGRLEALT